MRRSPVRGLVPRDLVHRGERIPYLVHVPEGYRLGRAWPAILYAHGAGEVGRDGWRPAEVGLGPWLRRCPDRFPCLVVIPQVPEPDPELAPLFLAALDDARASWFIDPERICLTGISLGGTVAWRLAAAHPRRFAALAPICGVGRPADAPRLARVPIWAFHGEGDALVPVQATRGMIATVRAAGGAPLYSEVPGAPHEVWDAAYGDPAFVAWMLGALSSPTTGGGAPRGRWRGSAPPR